jgi:Sigma-70 region 2
MTSTDETVTAAIAGDESAFATLAERYRRELHVHCYRMLASFDEAEDAVQETFLHAWRGRSGFEDGSQFRALIARDVLGWPATETAAALGTSVAAANSALQRARATMQVHLPPRRADWSAREPTAQERRLLGQFIDAHERLDAEGAIALAARDLRITMPPHPVLFGGRDAIRPLMADAAAMGDWRVLPVAANRMPAAAGYLRRPGDTEFRAFKLDVMRMEAGLIAEVTTFNADLFPAFGLKPAL